MNAIQSPSARARAALVADGGTLVDLPILLPANLVLEVAGEGLRQRLFFVTPPEGEELCLRPDLTLPAVVRYCEGARSDDASVAWACQGPVFRAPRPGDRRAAEFTQIGLERFGDADILAADVAVFLAAWRGVTAAVCAPLHVRLCDGALLPLVLEKADLPEVWRTALQEQVTHTRAFLARLHEAGQGHFVQNMPALHQDLVALSQEQAQARVHQILDRDGLTLTSSRSLEDITARLVTKAKRALAPPLPATCVQNLEALARFRQTSNVRQTLDHVRELAGELGVDLSDWRETWNTRLDAIAAKAPDALQHCRFDALGEEAFDYYDGMAFDISESDDFTKPLATGGRYDCLVGEVSGGERRARAVGCVIRPDRFDASPA